MTPNPVTTSSTILSLSHISSKPLTWLWPGRIPLGHLTLLDAAPGSGLSLFALTLAACISSGTPLPDGTPTQQGNVMLIAPYDAPDDTIKPRFEAAGGDLTRLVIFRPLVQETPQTTVRSRALEFPRDLDQLATTIHQLDARLVIIDPASAVTGLHRCLPALIERSLHRQAILRFLQNSSTPRHIRDITHATSYDYEAGRKMLVRMRMAGELVSPASGLYTTANHPCLATFTADTPAVPTLSSLVANVPDVPSPSIAPASIATSPQTPTTSNPPQHNVPTVPDTGSPSHFIPWGEVQSHPNSMDSAQPLWMRKTNVPPDSEDVEHHLVARNVRMNQSHQIDLT